MFFDVEWELRRDNTEKKDIYEQAGEEEYWIVSPQSSVEIYYLKDRKYILEQNYMLQDDKDDEDYNEDVEISLKAFPHIKMTLGDIFERDSNGCYWKFVLR